MKLIGYLRVSTDVQAERGLGLDVQRSAIGEWSAAAGHTVVSWFTDAGVSGSNGLDTRVGLHDALAALRDGLAGGIVVYRLDRLARDLVLQEQLLAEVWRGGAEVFSCSTAETEYLADDPADPSRRLIRQILGAVAEYERAMIRLRMEAGRRRKHGSGGYAGYGSPAYGWTAQDGQLIRDEAEAVAVDRIRELRQAGTSLRAIAAALDAEGHRPKRAARWSAEAVRRIVSRL